MNIWTSVHNLVRYGTWELEMPVDPVIVGTIFREAIEALSFYSPEWDTVSVVKNGRDSLDIGYCSVNKKMTHFNGIIYVAAPRTGFEEVDFASCMSIDQFSSDGDGELVGAIRTIAERTGIEKVVVAPGICEENNDVDALTEIRGSRSFNLVEKYGLQPSL